MVDKKKVLSDLQKFNTELNKHLGGLNFDDLKNDKVFSKKESFNEELFTLIGSNVMDLKVEIASLRQNLMDGMQGIFVNLISEYQNQFSVEMNNFYNQIIVNLKEGLSNEISLLKNEMSELKLDYQKLLAENKSLSTKLNIFNQDTLKLKEEIMNFSKVNTGDKQGLLKYLSRIDSKLTTNLIENKKQEKQFEELISKSQKQITQEVKYSELKSQNINPPEITEVVIEEKPLEINNEDSSYINKENTVRKILAIDEKLKKLEALK